MTILQLKKPSCHSSKEIGNQIVRSDHATQWKDFFCLKIEWQKEEKINGQKKTKRQKKTQTDKKTKR